MIRLRFGLGGEEPPSLQAIGTRLDMTSERVRKIEFEALERLAVSRELAPSKPLRARENGAVPRANRHQAAAPSGTVHSLVCGEEVLLPPPNAPCSTRRARGDAARAE